MTTDRHIMREPDAGSEPDDPTDELATMWSDLTDALTGSLDGLGMCEAGAFLRLELIGPEPKGAAPEYYPYVHFAATGELDGVVAEMPGDLLIHPLYALDDAQAEALRGTGWEDNIGSGELEWTLEFSSDDAEWVATQVVTILRDFFGIVHPQLLTFRCKGFVPEIGDILGLTETDKVPIDKPTLATFGGGDEARAHVVRSRAELIPLVAEVVGEFVDDEPEVDGDGDFVLRIMGQLAWVRVLDDQAAVEILARVVHGVRSQRGAAVEIGILNRDAAWVRWTLRERDVWQSIMIPAQPFAPTHLKELLKVFCRAMAATRDDLALRTGGSVG